jgi:2-aminoadipate transaminase
VTSTALFAARATGITGSVIDSSTSLLQAQTHDVVRLAMGSPAADAIPAEQFERLAAEVFARAGDGAFDYGPTEGEPGLRAQVLRLIADTEQRQVPPERLLITAGGMQGLDLACKLFVEAGDLVVVESPTYTNGSATITGYQGELLEAPVDGDGLVVAVLPDLVAAAGRTPKLIYTIPTFQNPSGTTLSLERREALVELAESWGALILEDDPYTPLRFEGEYLPTIEALAAGRVPVLGVRTFSKVLAPGLRVGWLTAEPEVIARMINAKQSMDTCTNVPLQRLVEAFLAEGLLPAHLERQRRVYRERRDAMTEALAAELEDIEYRCTQPAGGLFLWLTLPEAIDTQDLFDAALAEGVAFIPGPAFSASGAFANALRLCFASSSPERIREGVRRLARVVRRRLECGGSH